MPQGLFSIAFQTNRETWSNDNTQNNDNSFRQCTFPGALHDNMLQGQDPSGTKHEKEQ